MIRRAAPMVMLALGLVGGPLPAQESGAYQELSRFSEVLRHISENHADSVTYRRLVRAAIDGMLHSLDPHSWFLPREEVLRLDALERGELATIGVEVELADGVATIIAVVEDGPADKSGLRPGDRITAVEGEPTAGLAAKAIALRLAGEKGSRVRVTVERGPRLEPDSLTVTARREMAKPAPSVRHALMVDDSTGLVVLRQFGEKSADELRRAIRELRGDGMRRLILDLRGNPGGIVTEAVAMAERFLPAGTLVFSTRGRQRVANAEYRTGRNGEFRDLPLVVLIDEHSASASEALAASLQDHDRAVIAGRRSFGKALMQTGFLVNDGYVQLTIGHVVSPSGRVIQRPYEGLGIEQYLAFAGDSTRQDTSRTYTTAGGRLVRGGGGVAPDVALPGSAAPPRWFSVAADSGWDRAVADSVAFLLAADAATRERWRHDSAGWHDRVLTPFLDTVRRRLGVAATVDTATATALARRLAARVATVRWGADAGIALLLHSDPDVEAAAQLFR